MGQSPGRIFWVLIRPPQRNGKLTMLVGKSTIELEHVNFCTFTLPETNIALENPKRKVVFQPSIFRCYVSFREGKKMYSLLTFLLKMEEFQAVLHSLKLPANTPLERKQWLEDEFPFGKPLFSEAMINLNCRMTFVESSSTPGFQAGCCCHGTWRSFLCRAKDKALWPPKRRTSSGWVESLPWGSHVTLSWYLP